MLKRWQDNRPEADVYYENEVEGLKHAAGRMLAHCPFHDDRVRSFAIYPDSGNYHCFACGEKGSMIDFQMKMHHQTFKEAARTLENLC
jgi:DNA primase